MTDFYDTQAKTWTEVRKYWEFFETVSGPGSTVEMTAPLRDYLKDLFARREITSILDIPCGDWNWMRHVELGDIDYLGWDIEPTNVARNVERWPERRFAQVNILTCEQVPAVDLILCRDFLIHLPNEHIGEVLAKFIASGSRYLLTTNHPQASNDLDLDPVGELFPAYWQRLVNLEAAPFGLTGRVEAFPEPGHPVGEGQEMTLFELPHA